MYGNNLKKFINVIKNINLKKIIILDIDSLFVDIENSLNKIKINLFNNILNREGIDQ